ncbi:hypothetical protein PFISCL1PPCAC_14455, partial [Pristionchus fissidentatus]
RHCLLSSSTMELLALFGFWVSAMQISLMALPLSFVQQWYKRGSSEGFSPVQLIVPIPIQICWTRYGLLTDDTLMVVTNAILLATSLVYFLIFIFYLPEKVAINYKYNFVK